MTRDAWLLLGTVLIVAGLALVAGLVWPPEGSRYRK